MTPGWAWYEVDADGLDEPWETFATSFADAERRFLRAFRYEQYAITGITWRG